MSAETQRHIHDLMSQFRELVVSLEEEQEDLTQRLRDLTVFPSPTSTSTASPTDEPSATATTTSSGPLSTGSTQPPSYKTALRLKHQPTTIRPPEPIPVRPPRSKSLRSITLPRVHTTNTRDNNFSDRINTILNRNLLRMASSGAARGALIVLEGLDRVGKSTIATKLVEHLRRTDRPVSFGRFPDRNTPIGQLIDSFLKSGSKKVDEHSLHLLFSANRWEFNKSIRQTLSEGTTVILDRYSYSGIAYSSAKKELSIEWCRDTERGLPKPDLIIYLELSKEAQLRRPGFGDERFETEEYQELVRQQYEKLISGRRESWLRVDVDNKSPDQILGEIILPVRRCLESSADTAIGSLDFS